MTFLKVCACVCVCELMPQDALQREKKMKLNKIHPHKQALKQTGRLYLNRANSDAIIYSVHSLPNGISPGPVLLRAPWQIRGPSRVSTPGRHWVAGQSLDGG